MATETRGSQATKSLFGSSFRRILGKKEKDKTKPEKMTPRLPRPHISLPILARESQPVYEEVEDLLEREQRRKEYPSFATLPRVGSIGSMNYTRMFPKTCGTQIAQDETAGRRRPPPPPTSHSTTRYGKKSSHPVSRSHSTAQLSSSRPVKERHSYEALSEWEKSYEPLRPSGTWE